MKKIFFGWILILVFIFPLSSCYNEPDIPPIDPNLVKVTSDINNETTWETGKVYLIKKFDFYVNQPLHIQPGTIIKFHTSAQYLTIGNSGKIIANGTSSQPIIFTSYKDDSHGGDTNGDEGSSSPSMGDWGTIDLNGHNGSEFQYCQFLYSGLEKASALKLADNASAKVKNCTFAHNDGTLADGGALNASFSGAETIIEDNIFYDNEKPLSITTTYSLGNSNRFHNPDNSSEKNTYNAIFVKKTGDGINQNISWQEDEVAYVLGAAGDLELWIFATLTLADEVVLKFKQDFTLILNKEFDPIIYYNANGVFFTSFKDDEHKGDSNGDGSNTSPNDFDWAGIWDEFHLEAKIWDNVLYDSNQK